MNSELKINGYTVIASVRRWEEWTMHKDERGDIRFSWLDNAQDQLDTSDIEEWTFKGGDYWTDDHTFKTYEELEKFLKTLEPVKESA